MMVVAINRQTAIQTRTETLALLHAHPPLGREADDEDEVMTTIIVIIVVIIIVIIRGHRRISEIDLESVRVSVRTANDWR